MRHDHLPHHIALAVFFFSVFLIQDLGYSAEKKRVGYEIFQFKSSGHIVAWVSKDITQTQFDAISLPLGWFKNQPREMDADHARFQASPDQKAGIIIRENHYGHQWVHAATVFKLKIPLDQQDFLTGCMVRKNHEVTFNAGKKVSLLLSPGGKTYIRINRDAQRKVDHPTIPEGWRLVSHQLRKKFTQFLPKETMVIRTDNQDSYQGPIRFDEKINWK